MRTGRISEHGFLADGRSAALVDTAGSVNWWCPARFDGPSVFGRLLDDDAGHWAIRPEGGFTSTRSYLDDTLVLRTVFATPTGTVAVTDALALEPGARGHDIGLRSPRVLARVVEGIDGEVPMRVDYAPRFEYGRVGAYLTERDGVILATAGACRLELRAGVGLAFADGTAVGAVHRPGRQRPPLHPRVRPDVRRRDAGAARRRRGGRRHGRRLALLGGPARLPG